MSKLLFIFERDMPTVSILKDVYRNLKSYPEIEPDFVYLTDVTPNLIDSHDIVLFVRPMDILSFKIASHARQAGHLVVTLCDDDLLNLPKSIPTIPWRKKGLMKALSQSDVIGSSSPNILKKYVNLTAGKRTALSDTIVKPEEFEGLEIDRNKSDSVRIVYAAAPDHASLFEKYISPIASRLGDEFGDKLSFTFVSVHPEIEGVNCRFFAGMHLFKFRNFMKEQQFDIGVAPLHDDDFSKCKYFNKFIEYTTQGIVGIYSNVEPYTYVVEDKKTGFFADDDPESWYNAIRTAIRQKELRHSCLLNAIEYLKKNHSERACMDRIIGDIPELLKTDDSYRRCGGFGFQKMKYYMSKPFDWLYLTWFFIRMTGVSGFLKRVKSHFVNSKAYRRRKEK